jgi:hypothetical protein
MQIQTDTTTNTILPVVFPRILLVGLAISLFTGCATEPLVTRAVYNDRSAWIRLEVNPYAEEVSKDTLQPELVTPSAGVLAALLEGFHAQKDSSPGPGSWMLGKPGYDRAFAESEILLLSAQLAKGFSMASPKEWVAYCLTADYSATERLITTGWAYVRPPYFYFRLNEYRTAVRVPSPATSTPDACRMKPVPGYRTADRFFKLDYEPKELVVTHGIFGGTMFKSRGEIYNSRGEVEFKLEGLSTLKPAGRGTARVPDTPAPPTPTASKSNASPRSAASDDSNPSSLSPSAVDKLNRLFSSSSKETAGFPKSSPGKGTTTQPAVGFGPEPRIP